MRNCTYRRRLGRVWGGPKIMFLQFPNFIEPNFPNYVLLETNSMCSDRARQPAIKLIQFFSILGRRKQQPSPTSPKSPPSGGLARRNTGKNPGGPDRRGRWHLDRQGRFYTK